MMKIKKSFLTILIGCAALSMTTIVLADDVDAELQVADDVDAELQVADDGSVDGVPVAEDVKAFVASSQGDGSAPEDNGTDMTPLTEADIAAINQFKALDMAPPGVKVPESIINRDTRTKTDPYDSSTAGDNSFPARSVVLLTFSGGRCTGWMLGKDLVITAGHCVHTGGTSGSWRTTSSFRAYPGYTGSSAPYGSCTAKNLYSVLGWTRDKNWAYDYGAVKLSCTVGNSTGWMGARTTSSPLSEPTIITGYPGDKPLEQWMSADRVRQAWSRKLWYKADTTGGMSGSPIWGDNGWLSAPHSLGVHAYGAQTAGNSGTRWTSARIGNLITWMNR